MTITGKIVAELTKTEQEYGATYITLSRVQRFSDIGIKDGINKNRLCDKIRKHKKVKSRILEEERLRSLAAITEDKYF